jgi:predicted DNA binding CopG/RHH family protein
MAMRKKVPAFESEAAEREFWAQEDSTDYIDWSQATALTLPNLKPTLRTISLRLPELMLAELKLMANQRDVPYQSLMKVFLAERIRQEQAATGAPEPRTASRRAREAKAERPAIARRPSKVADSK